LGAQIELGLGVHSNWAKWTDKAGLGLGLEFGQRIRPIDFIFSFIFFFLGLPVLPLVFSFLSLGVDRSSPCRSSSLVFFFFSRLPHLLVLSLISILLWFIILSLFLLWFIILSLFLPCSSKAAR
jgi:hypothetical protein